MQYNIIQNIDENSRYIKIRYTHGENNLPLIVQTPYLYIPLGFSTNKINNLCFLDLEIDKELNNDLFQLKKKLTRPNYWSSKKSRFFQPRFFPEWVQIQHMRSRVKDVSTSGLRLTDRTRLF